jgi:hypothetical protein
MMIMSAFNSMSPKAFMEILAVGYVSVGFGGQGERGELLVQSILSSQYRFARTR